MSNVFILPAVQEQQKRFWLQVAWASQVLLCKSSFVFPGELYTKMWVDIVLHQCTVNSDILYFNFHQPQTFQEAGVVLLCSASSSENRKLDYLEVKGQSHLSFPWAHIYTAVHVSVWYCMFIRWQIGIRFGTVYIVWVFTASDLIVDSVLFRKVSTEPTKVYQH